MSTHPSSSRLVRPAARLLLARSLFAVGLLLGLGGCHDLEEALEEALGEAPQGADPRLAFPAFEKAVEGPAEASGPWRFDPCVGWTASAGPFGGRAEVGRVGLGDDFALELPPGVGGWIGANLSNSGAEATLLVHYASGSSVPTAYLYAERWSVELAPLGYRAELGSTSLADVGLGNGPGHDLGRFQARVDRALELSGPAGDPIGYTSDPGSFVGWRWLGPCRSSKLLPPEEPNEIQTPRNLPYLRLSRSQGRWHRRADGRPVPAFQVLATVGWPERPNTGLQLALVCARTPECPQAPDLARMLGSLRLGDGAGAGGGVMGGAERFAELAEAVGIGSR